MADIVFKCALCPKEFDDELSLNSHTLFDHGNYRGKCATDVQQQKDFLAEEMRSEIITQKTKDLFIPANERERWFFSFALDWLKKNGYKPPRFPKRLKDLPELNTTEIEFCKRHFNIDESKDNLTIRNYVNFKIEKDHGFDSEISFIVKEVHGWDDDYAINDWNKHRIAKIMIKNICTCDHHWCEICTIRI